VPLFETLACAEIFKHRIPHKQPLTELYIDEASSMLGKGGTKKCWWLRKLFKPMRILPQFLMLCILKSMRYYLGVGKTRGQNH